MSLWKLYGVVVTSVVMFMLVAACALCHATTAGKLGLAAVVIGIWGIVVALVME